MRSEPVRPSALPGSEHGSFPRLMSEWVLFSAMLKHHQRKLLREGSATGSSQQMALLQSQAQTGSETLSSHVRSFAAFFLQAQRAKGQSGPWCVFFVHLASSSYRCVFCPCSKAVAINCLRCGFSETNQAFLLPPPRRVQVSNPGN